MNTIKNLPTPIAGLALGSVALGNLLQPYSPSLQLLFSLLSLIIIALLTIKFVLGFDKLKKEMENPVIATVLATYPMSIMLLASFSKKYIGLLSMPVWIIGIFLDFCVVCYAIYNFIIKERHINKIYSYSQNLFFSKFKFWCHIQTSIDRKHLFLIVNYFV